MDGERVADAVAAHDWQAALFAQTMKLANKLDRLSLTGRELSDLNREFTKNIGLLREWDADLGKEAKGDDPVDAIRNRHGLRLAKAPVDARRRAG